MTAGSAPVDVGRGLLLGTENLIGNRDPLSIRRWLIEWTIDGDCFALAGPLHFTTDLGNALFALRGKDRVDGVFMWPSVPGTPVAVYSLARETLRRFHGDDAAHEAWASALRAVDCDLPDVFTLLEYSERSKFKKAAA